MNNNDMKGGAIPSKIKGTNMKPSKTTNPSPKIGGSAPMVSKNLAKKDSVTFKPTGSNNKNGDFSS